MANDGPNYSVGLPARHWVQGVNGLWWSHERKRCTDNCDDEILPASPAEEEA